MATGVDGWGASSEYGGKFQNTIGALAHGQFAKLRNTISYCHMGLLRKGILQNYEQQFPL